jgi:hypothetical protein
MTGARIRLRIDQLALHGVAPRDRTALAAAFRAELTRVVALGAPTGSGATPAVAPSASQATSAVAAARTAGAMAGRAINSPKNGGGR